LTRTLIKIVALQLAQKRQLERLTLSRSEWRTPFIDNVRHAFIGIQTEPLIDQIGPVLVVSDDAPKLIGTRDQDLRTLDPFSTIRILPAREALALLTETRG
jgi:hypothetical protein